MKQRRPMVAPGWISIPVTVRLNCETIRASSVNARSVHTVSRAMQQDGMKTGVTEEDLQRALGGWIAVENGVDLFADGPKHTALV